MRRTGSNGVPPMPYQSFLRDPTVLWNCNRLREYRMRPQTAYGVIAIVAEYDFGIASA
jgi:hypothetical protein